MNGFMLKTTQTQIDVALRESALRLSEEHVRAIAETEGTCLAENGRVSFGGSAAARLVRAFAESPFLVGAQDAELLIDLIGAFYELREELPAHTTDAEIIEILHESFDGEAAGSVDVALSLARESLLASGAAQPYELIDDDGRAYRWDPEEWHDDVTANGWYGERWDGCDD